MTSRLKYLKSRARARNKDENEVENHQHDSVVSEGDEAINPYNDDLKDLVEKMKTIPVKRDNMEELKQHLRTTREYRDELLKNKKLNLDEVCPYFFVQGDESIELILFEYVERFGHLKAERGLLSNWYKYSSVLEELIKTQFESQAFYSNWPEDVENFMVLLKLFPASRVGKKKLAQRETFHNASEKLIIFRKVNFATHIFTMNLSIFCFYFRMQFDRLEHHRKKCLKRRTKIIHTSLAVGRRKTKSYDTTLRLKKH